jgi:hypothetical protein
VKNNKIKSGIKSMPVKSISTIQFVDFASNEISLDDVMPFVEQIPEQSKLRIVNLRGNFLEDKDSKTMPNDRATQLSKLRDDLEVWRLKSGLTLAILGI